MGKYQAYIMFFVSLFLTVVMGFIGFYVKTINDQTTDIKQTVRELSGKFDEYKDKQSDNAKDINTRVTRLEAIWER